MKEYEPLFTGDISDLIVGLFKEDRGAILDLGAGYGSMLYALNKKGLLDRAKRKIAVEISPIKVNKIKELNLGVECIVSDAANLHMLDDGSVDVIFSNQVIEHVKDDNMFLREAFRLLSKSGQFYLSTVFKKRYGWFYHRCNGKWTLEPTHLREYTDEKQLLDKIENNFEIVVNKKSLLWFVVIDVILKILGVHGNIPERSRWLHFLRMIKLPFIGYYNWELLLRKK